MEENCVSWRRLTARLTKHSGTDYSDSPQWSSPQPSSSSSASSSSSPFLRFPFFAVIAFARCGIAFNPPFIPLGWTTVYPCAVDVPSRVLANVVTTQYTDNTPASCIERCDAANYTYAGVEYSNECHCGTGLVGTPASAPSTDCDLACTGDPTLSCGGSWRIQVRSLLPSRHSAFIGTH